MRLRRPDLRVRRRWMPLAVFGSLGFAATGLVLLAMTAFGQCESRPVPSPAPMVVDCGSCPYDVRCVAYTLLIHAGQDPRGGLSR